MERACLNRAIGVIDSGVGGLTVANELMRQLPNEKLIYVGDTLRCPYGPRTKEEVMQYTLEMVQFLMKHNVKMIVVACNTATAFSIKHLKEILSIPVIGVIQPGARETINATRNSEVGVIGTIGTIRSNAYVKALKKINQELKITTLACPKFVPLVESGITSGEQAYSIIKDTLQPLMQTNIDTLVLGCTHYPLLGQLIQDVMGEAVSIISSSEETAREVGVVLELHDVLQKEKYNFSHTFYTTGDVNHFENLSNLIFENKFYKCRQIDIEQSKLKNTRTIKM